MFNGTPFTGKTILITGGGTGLGKSMASYLSSLGAQIVITSRRQKVIEEAAQSISDQSGHPVLGLQGDVREIVSVREVISAAAEKFGSIDGLINNAAGNFVSPTERLSHRAFQSVIGIVLQGSINYTLELGKYWIEKKVAGTVQWSGYCKSERRYCSLYICMDRNWVYGT